MNEKLKELAEQAGIPTYYPEGISERLEKFAQLIAADCAELCADIDGGENMFSRAIRKRFGVE